MKVQSFRIALVILLPAIALEAQWSDRIYPFAELTDEMRDRINLKDGSVEDWLEVLGEPTLTPLDFATHPSFPEYDPSSFDFRIWLAWHDVGNHLFVAAEIVDDIYVHVDEYFERPTRLPPTEASVWFWVDGNKSGGAMIERRDGRINRDILMVQAQRYWGVAKNYENDSNLTLQWLTGEAPWITYLPYADGGGGIVESQPIFYVVEFYVTPFDRLVSDAPEQSVVRDLVAGKAIGFAMEMLDHDTSMDDDFLPDRVHGLFGPDAAWDMGGDLSRRSDHWAQGILLGEDSPAGGTAVESLTWGRIKASLSK